MNVKIKDLMVERVITARPHHSVEHLRGLMENNGLHAVPILGPEGEAVGIVTSSDLIGSLKAGTPASRIMSRRVFCAPAYNDIHVAARVMRKHGIHHVVVTHEKQVVGIISSFDLLKLVEDKRFTAKPAPRAEKRKSGRRKAAATA